MISFLILSTINIFGQNIKEFTIADSSIYSSFAIDQNGLIHAAWVNVKDRQIYYSVIDNNGNIIVKPKKNEKSYWCSGTRIVTKNEKKIIVWTQGEGFVVTGNSWIWGQQTNLYVDTPKTTIQYNSEFYDAGRGNPFPAFIDDTTYYVIWSGGGPNYSSAIWGQKQTTSLRPLGNNIVLSDSNNLNLIPKHRMPTLLNIPDQKKYCMLWIDNREKNNNIYGRFFDYQDRPLTSSFRINDKKGTGENIFYYSAKISSKNEIVITWCDKIEQSWNIFLKKIDSDGSIIIPSKLITDNQDNVCDYPTVDLSIDEESNVAVAWEVYNKNQFSRIVIRGFDKNLNKVGEVNNMLSDSTHAHYYLYTIQFYNNNLYFLWSNTENSKPANRMWIIPINLITSVQNYPSTNYQSNDKAYISINGIYPNPFNNSTTINFTLFESMSLQIKVYDLLGREVITLIDRYLQNDNYKINLSSQLSTGVYLVSFISPKFLVTKKIITIK